MARHATLEVIHCYKGAVRVRSEAGAFEWAWPEQPDAWEKREKARRERKARGKKVRSVYEMECGDNVTNDSSFATHFARRFHFLFVSNASRSSQAKAERVMEDFFDTASDDEVQDDEVQNSSDEEKEEEKVLFWGGGKEEEEDEDARGKKWKGHLGSPRREVRMPPESPVRKKPFSPPSFPGAEEEEVEPMDPKVAGEQVRAYESRSENGERSVEQECT